MANYIGQIAGVFRAGEEILELIRKQERKNTTVAELVKIGIQADSSQVVYLNNEAFEIGQTGILQFKDVSIQSIKFEAHPQKTVVTKNGYAGTHAIIDYLYSDYRQDLIIDKGFNILLAGGGAIDSSVMPHENTEYFPEDNNKTDGI